MDNLTRDVIRAKALGYGCHYGKYKADHPNRAAEIPVKEREPERTKICQNCGNEFSLDGRKANTKYCCTFCYNQANAKRAFQRAREKAGTAQIKTKICKICGREFSIEDRYAGTKCCSPECKRENRRGIVYLAKKKRREREACL